MLSSIFEPETSEAERVLSAGELCIAEPGDVLVSGPLGSCIALVLYDRAKREFGMGHIMLPGTGGPKSEGDLRYSERAIEKLVKGLATGGDGVGSRLLACAAGGANVLRDPQDTLCGELRRAVLEGLSRRGIPLVGVDLGGEIRRQVRLDSGSGKVFCAVGGEPETLLHEFLRED